MTIFSPALLRQLSPRARAEMRALDEKLNSTSETAAEAADTAAEAKDTADETAAQSWQPASEMLSTLASLEDIGVVVLVGNDEAAVYPMNTWARYLGKGTTVARPGSPQPGIYFDTTLAVAGKPVFYTGTGWVDATGTAV